MNIIKHLTEKVSSVIIKGDRNHGETALMEKFYSIVLARLTDQDAYNKLTNHGKLSAKKTTFYKVFHNIDWSEEDASKKIIASLAENHDLKEEAVKGLVKQATPLMFTELYALAKDKPLPEYLQELLKDVTDDDSFFVKFIPSWALSLLPKEHVATQVFQTQEKVVISTQQDTKHQSDDESVSENDSENEHNDKNRTNSQTEDTAKVLPNPVHADASGYSYENIASPDASPTASPVPSSEADSSGIKWLLPIIGMIIFASLAWALLRGCQESGVTDLTNQSVKPSVSVASDEADVAVVKSDTATQATQTSVVTSSSTAINDQIKNNASTVHLSVDKDGKLKDATVLAGSNALSYKVNSAIANVFGELALDSAKVSVDDKRSEDLLAMDKLNDLLLLVQSVPNASMVVSGNAIRFDAPSESARKKLVAGAQGILSNFSISSGALTALEVDNDNKTKSSDNPPADSPEDDKNSNLSEAENTTANDNKKSAQAEQPANAETPTEATNEEDTNKKATDKKEASEATEQTAKSTTDATKSDNNTKLDVDTAVTDSIDKSKKVLAGLTGTGNQTDIKAIETALNAQIINFAVNDDEIPEANKVILNQAAAVLKDMDVRLTIIGHTDSDGDEAYNERLSQDRSFSVKKYLMSQGMSSGRMKADGVGERKPIASNSTPEGKFQNRRIEFKVIKIEPTDDKDLQKKAGE